MKQFLSLMFALAVIASSASAEVVTNVTFPLTGVVATGCTEQVVLAGDLHVVVRQTTDDNGGIHVGLHINTQNVSGTGLTSGAEYRGAQQQNTVQNIIGPPPLEFSDTMHAVLVSRGKGGNLMISGQTHVTVNAGGEVTASFSDFSSSCN